jgi:hypothetical protein
MTTKVQIVVNGPFYVVDYEAHNKDGVLVAKGEVRGALQGQGFQEVYLGQDCTFTAVERYRPLPQDADPVR